MHQTATLNWALGDYIIESVIRAGGRSTVYAGRRRGAPESSDLRALKVIAIGTDPDARTVVEAERRGAELQQEFARHHGLVPWIEEIGETRSCLYVAMEYVPGEDLSDTLMRGPIPPPRAVDIAIELATFLERTHHFDVPGRAPERIIHADLKPGNIRLKPDGHLCVLDFGIAKAMAERRIETTQKWGTRQYMSPEWLQTGTIDEQVDYWSLGVLLYEMLAGYRPFRRFERHDNQLEEAIRRRERPEALPPHIDLRIQQVVGRLLAPDIRQRYASATEIRAALSACRPDVPTLPSGRRPDIPTEAVRPVLPSLHAASPGAAAAAAAAAASNDAAHGASAAHGVGAAHRAIAASSNGGAPADVAAAASNRAAHGAGAVHGAVAASSNGGAPAADVAAAASDRAAHGANASHGAAAASSNGGAPAADVTAASSNGDALAAGVVAAASNGAASAAGLAAAASSGAASAVGFVGAAGAAASPLIAGLSASQAPPALYDSPPTEPCPRDMTSSASTALARSQPPTIPMPPMLDVPTDRVVMPDRRPAAAAAPSAAPGAVGAAFAPTSAAPVASAANAHVRADVPTLPMPAPMATPTSTSTPDQAVTSPRARRQAGRRLFVAVLWMQFAAVLASEGIGCIAAERLRADAAVADEGNLEAVLKRRTQLAGWTIFDAGLHVRADPVLRDRLLSLADVVLANYRQEQPTIGRVEWDQARGWLNQAVGLYPDDRRILSKLRYTEGQLQRLLALRRAEGGQTKLARESYYAAIQRFREAAALDPQSPDPYLGLTHTYIYGLGDVDNAIEALKQAEKRGYRLNRRERAQLGDGYRARGERTLRSARDLQGDQQRDALDRAKKDFKQCVESFAPIVEFANAGDQLRRCEARLTEIEEQHTPWWKRLFESKPDIDVEIPVPPRRGDPR